MKLCVLAVSQLYQPVMEARAHCVLQVLQAPNPAEAKHPKTQKAARLHLMKVRCSRAIFYGVFVKLNQKEARHRCRFVDK